MAGNKNSGRKKAPRKGDGTFAVEQTLSEAQIKALYLGTDPLTPGGLMEILVRADKMRLNGKMTNSQHNALVASSRERRHLFSIDKLHTEVESLRMRAEHLEEQRDSLLQARDVGPPDDAMPH